MFILSTQLIVCIIMTSNNKFLHVLNLPTGEIFTNQSDRIPSNQDLIAVDKAILFSSS